MFCKHCGTQLAPEAQFCAKCGASTNDQASVYRPASQARRFANHILDGFFFYVIFIIIALVIGLLGGFDESHTALQITLQILSIFAFPACYLFFEGIWGRTPAKFITHTKVVMRDGSKPDFAHILGRSFARLIPFDNFSFLFRTVGWHDSLSKTLVVPADYTPEQVQHIDTTHHRSTAGTIVIVLVAVLVFIAVVGLLASIVLLALNSARAKSRDAARVVEIRQEAKALELYHDDNESYPTSLQQLAPEYIETLPQAPTPPDGTCTADQNTYQYRFIDKDNYRLTFCLGGDSSGLVGGMHTVTPLGIN